MRTKSSTAIFAWMCVGVGLWISGCGDDDTNPVDASAGDADQTQDADVAHDAAVPDAAPGDAAMQDADVMDANVLPDATVMDANVLPDADVMDANVLPDAGVDAQTNDDDAGDDLSDAGGDAAADEFPEPIAQAGELFASFTAYEMGGETHLALDSAGNVLVATVSIVDLPGQPNAGYGDAVVRKFDSAGTLLWVRQFGSVGDDWSSGVSSDSAGNVYVGGFSRGGQPFPNQTGTNDRGGFLRKYDAAGTHQWTIRLAGATSPFGEDNQPPRVQADPSGNNVYVLTRGFLRRYTGSGDEDWTNRTLRDSDPQPWLATDPAGNVLYLGRHTGEPFYRFVQKINPSGGVAWTRQIPGGRNTLTSQSEWGSLVTDASGDVYVTGMTDDSQMGPGMGAPSTVFVRKYDTDGDALWTRLADPAESIQGWRLGALVVDAVGNTQTVLFQEGELRSIRRLRVHHRGLGGGLTTIVDLPDLPTGHGIYRYPMASLRADAQGNIFLVGVADGPTPQPYLARLAID